MGMTDLVWWFTEHKGPLPSLPVSINQGERKCRHTCAWRADTKWRSIQLKIGGRIWNVLRNASENKIMTRFYGGEVALGRTIFFAGVFCGLTVEWDPESVAFLSGPGDESVLASSRSALGWVPCSATFTLKFGAPEQKVCCNLFRQRLIPSSKPCLFGNCYSMSCGSLAKIESGL